MEPANRSIPIREKFASGCGNTGLPTARGIPRLKPWEEVKYDTQSAHATLRERVRFVKRSEDDYVFNQIDDLAICELKRPTDTDSDA